MKSAIAAPVYVPLKLNEPRGARAWPNVTPRRSTSPPNFRKCLPFCQLKLSVNGAIEFERMRGPICRCRLYMLYPPSAPLTFIVGGPYSSGNRDTSGKPILPTTSYAGSFVVPNTSASLKRCHPARASFTMDGEIVRVHEMETFCVRPRLLRSSWPHTGVPAS